MNQNSNKITNKNIMVENINRLLYQKNWSIRQFANFADGSKGEKSRGGELLSGSAGGNVRQCTECGTEYDTE